MKSLRSVLLLLFVSGLLASGVLTVTSKWGAAATTDAAQRALVSKDVTADILPPPLDLIELRLVLSEAVEGTMPLATAQAEAARLEKEYGERVTYWTRNPPYGLETQLLGKQHEAGTRFIAASQAVMAALSSGDAAGAQAALKTANLAYLAHRAGVDATVKVSTAFADAAMDTLAALRRHLRLAPLAVFALSAIVLLGLDRRAHRAVWSASGGEPAHAAATASEVAGGNRAVDASVAAGSRMVDVLGSSRRVSDIVAEISAASVQQSAGVAQVGEAVVQMDQATQSNAALVQQSAAAADSLRVQARQLVAAVTVFRLRGAA